MNVSRVKVKKDSIPAYGDRRGTRIYHRDPQTGVVFDGEEELDDHSRASTGPGILSRSTLRAIDLYDRSMEPRNWTSSETVEVQTRHVAPESDKSKYQTKYEPKSPYRYHDEYRIAVVDDPVAKDEPEVGTSPGVQNREPNKAKKKARARRKLSPVEIEESSDEEGKREFVGWVMNGRNDDVGFSQRILFRRGEQFL